MSLCDRPIVGQHPTPVIHDLTEDTDFHGVLLAEVSPYLFFMHPTDVADRVIISVSDRQLEATCGRARTERRVPARIASSFFALVCSLRRAPNRQGLRLLQHVANRRNLSMKACLFALPLAMLAGQSLAAVPTVLAYDENSITRSVTVRLDDIDLSAADSAKKIRGLLQRAAAQVCRAPLGEIDGGGRDSHGCYVATLKRATSALAQAHPGLSAEPGISAPRDR